MVLTGQIQSGLGQEIIPVSFLSLPLNILSSGGIVSLVIISVWLLSPNVFAVFRYKSIEYRSIFLLLAPLNAFLVLYFVSFEELHIWHATALGIYLSYLNKFKKLNNEK